MLSATDPLPSHPQRILVAGVSGAGKTSLAGRLGQLLEVPHTEIDALFHGPHWTERTDFMADVDRLSSAPGWVTEWQYRQARPLLADLAHLRRVRDMIDRDYPPPLDVPTIAAKALMSTGRGTAAQRDVGDGCVHERGRHVAGIF